MAGVINFRLINLKFVTPPMDSEEDEGKALQIHHDDSKIDRVVHYKIADICSLPLKNTRMVF